MSYNRHLLAIQTLAAPTPNANHKTGPLIVSVQQTMLAILIVHVDQNVFSTRTAHAIKAALETVALILVLELAAITLCAG